MNKSTRPRRQPSLVRGFVILCVVVVVLMAVAYAVDAAGVALGWWR